MNFLKKYQLKDYNYILVIAVLILSIIGILAVGSASPSAQTKQIIGVSFGIVVMIVISFIDFEWILNFYWVIYGVNILLLLCVKFFGVNYNGAQRWIDLKFTTLQPSDLTKIFLILFFAKFLTNYESYIKEPRMIIKSVCLVLPSLYLIFTQPNLSNTICITAVFCVLMFLGGVDYKLIGITLGTAIPLAALLLGLALLPNQPFLKGYQQDRILAWVYPEKYETGYEIDGLSKAESLGAFIFHAGTKKENGKFYTAGGRVLMVVGFGADLQEAHDKALAAVESIECDNLFYRRDIGWRVL